MRPALLAWALVAITSICAAQEQPDVIKERDDADDEPESTIFNGIEVPPMTEIKGPEFAETIKSGYWFVKNYSPYCGHCKAIAPTWQTLYEFYYTSAPLEGRTKDPNPDPSSPNSFHGFYNFHFASLNCIAYGDVCKKNGVEAWPTFILYKDGEMVEKYSGDRSMESFSSYVEEKLESTKPGSRPREGLKVPKPGAKSVDRLASPDKPQAKDKDKSAGKEAADKQNEKIANKADLTADANLASETAKAAGKDRLRTGTNPNPQGTVVSLNAESFQTLVTTSQDPWFIKFYAPWCPHCKHMAPTWVQLAREMQGKLNIGEVNCEAEPRLCKDARIQAYPTLYFFRGGERVEYEGLRGFGDLLSFANKALDSDVQYVDAAKFREMEETEEVIFVYFFDHATTSEDFAALDRLTLSLIGHARVVKTDSDILASRFKIHTWPKLLVSRSGRPTYYTALAPKDMRDFRKVLEWMQSVWLPLVPELTATNAKEIMNNKFTVLGVLNRENPDEFKEAKRELLNAAIEWLDKQTQLFQLERQEMRDSKQLRIEEAEDRGDQRGLRQAKSKVISITEDTFRKQVSFAWVDSVFWARWLRRTYGIDFGNSDRVIINDEENRRFWDVTETGNWITPSRVSILETLTKVTAQPPKLPSRSTVGLLEWIFFQIGHMGSRHPWLTAIFVIIGVIGSLLAMKNSTAMRHAMRRSRNQGYFVLGDEKGGTGGILGLGGSTPNGKAD